MFWKRKPTQNNQEDETVLVERLHQAIDAVNQAVDDVERAGLDVRLGWRYAGIQGNADLYAVVTKQL